MGTKFEPIFSDLIEKVTEFSNLFKKVTEFSNLFEKVTHFGKKVTLLGYLFSDLFLIKGTDFDIGYNLYFSFLAFW